MKLSSYKGLLCLVPFMLGVFGCSTQIGSEHDPAEGRVWSEVTDVPGYKTVPLPTWFPSFREMWLYQFARMSGVTCSDPQWSLCGPGCGNVNCGPSCIGMVINYLTNRGVTSYCQPIPEAAERGFNTHAMTRWLYCDAVSSADAFEDHGVDNGYQCDDHATPWGATEEQMQTVLASQCIRSHFVARGDAATIDPYDYLRANVDAERLTVVHVSNCAFRPSGQPCTTSHWVLVYGYDDSGIYILDPGYQSPMVDGVGWGAGHRVPRNEFLAGVNGVGSNRVFFTIDSTLDNVGGSFLTHLPGTLVKREGSGHPEVYIVDDQLRLRWLVTEDELKSRRLYSEPGNPFGLVITIGEQEYASYQHGDDIDQPVTMRVTTCNDDTYYYLTLNDRGVVRKWKIGQLGNEEQVFAIMRSWGFDSDEVVRNHASCLYPNQTSWLLLRDGRIVQEEESGTFYYVMGGFLREMSSELFDELGYDEADALRLPQRVLFSTTQGVDPLHPMIQREDLSSCLEPVPVPSYDFMPGSPFLGYGGGESEEACEDLDHDSFFPIDCGGTDCDDGLETVYPGALEPCDGRDNDCDGIVDDPFDLMADRDNCGRCGHVCGPLAECGGGECISCGGGGQVCCHTGTACRDSLFCTEGTCQTGCISTEEICNGGDDDCDGVVDDGFDLSNDRENCGACHTICTVDQECHEGACRFPPSPETSHPCNNVDDDYDGAVDNFTIACTNACGAGLQTCVAGIVSACVATSPPTEVCNGVDDDCDGSIDEGGICPTFDCDVDGDGVQNAACAGPDCDDRDPSVYPGAPERCNGRDDSCNLGVDEGFDFLLDERNCGACGNVCPTGWTCFSGACSAPCTPTGVETCDTIDNDCDGLVDEGNVCTPPPPACNHRVEIHWANDAFWTFGTDIAVSGERLSSLYYWALLVGPYDMPYTDVCPGYVRLNLEVRLSPTTRWYVESDGAGGFIYPFATPPDVRVDGVSVPLTAINVSGWDPPAAMRFCVGTCP